MGPCMPVWHSRRVRLSMDAIEPPSWKIRLSWVSAGTLAILFLVSGVWKIADPLGWAVRTTELHVPHSASLAAALVVGIAETVGAVWILVPRLRRWGSILLGLLLAAFVIYFAANYSVLRGADCSCFPWIKRAVGPGFFIGDMAMLLLAAVAGLWAQRPVGARPAVVILATVTVFALVSWGVEAQELKGVRAPASITVNGQPYLISEGKVFVFFFNPECTHCYDAAKRMALLSWGDTQVVAVPVEQAQFAQGFLEETGLRATVTSDVQQLESRLGYKVYPYGVAIENGRTRGALTNFENGEPDATLRKLGFVR
jgi:uncharacterized membrane protein YphA (DoxX/SURF4 family)